MTVNLRVKGVRQNSRNQGILCRFQTETEVHVWKSLKPVKKDRLLRLETYLSGEEIRRANRFVFEKDRNSFIRTRGLLREIIGEYLSLKPGSVNLSEEAFEKPRLMDFEHRWLRFNVSHSGDYSLLAFAKNREIGVDLERKKIGIDFDNLADSQFSEDESTGIQKAVPAQKEALFYRCWTRKEALVKATGKGLSIPLKTFTVPLDEIPPGRQIQRKTICLNETNWQLYQPELISEEYESALAIQGEGPVELRFLET